MSFYINYSKYKVKTNKLSRWVIIYYLYALKSSITNLYNSTKLIDNFVTTRIIIHRVVYLKSAELQWEYQIELGLILKVTLNIKCTYITVLDLCGLLTLSFSDIENFKVSNKS